MTSEKALYILLYGCNNNVSYKDFITAREKIEKDLDVLDILKENIFVSDNMIYATSKELKDDDYNKLKEWYENDK